MCTSHLVLFFFYIYFVILLFLEEPVGISLVKFSIAVLTTFNCARVSFTFTH